LDSKKKYRSRGQGVGIVSERRSMSESAPTPEAIDELLEAGAEERARELLLAVPPNDERFAVVRVKLGLFDGSLPAGAAQQALIKLMRRDPEWPGAKELYQLASSQAYRGRESSASHSHPPPPVRK
jgi:hypothetical protein